MGGPLTSLQAAPLQDASQPVWRATHCVRGSVTRMGLAGLPRLRNVGSADLCYPQGQLEVLDER